MSKIVAPLSAELEIRSSTDLVCDTVREQLVVRTGEERIYDFASSLGDKGWHVVRAEVYAGGVLQVRRTLRVVDERVQGGGVLLAYVHPDAKLFVDDAVILEGRDADIVLRAHVVLDADAHVQVRQYVRVGAEAADAKVSESSKALLLGDAFVTTIPELDVRTDDAETSHAASVARPDERAVAYLAARGMPKEEAYAALVDGFLAYV